MEYNSGSPEGQFPKHIMLHYLIYVEMVPCLKANTILRRRVVMPSTCWGSCALAPLNPHP